MKLIIEYDDLAQAADIVASFTIARDIIAERDRLRAQVDLFVQDRRARGLSDYVKPPLGKPPAWTASATEWTTHGPMGVCHCGPGACCSNCSIGGVKR
jgi:hypothetical protein